jgi:hypothetical protein
MNLGSKNLERVFLNTIVWSETLVFVTIRYYFICAISSLFNVDMKVPRAQKASWKTLSLLTYRIGLLLVWTILALPGTILNSPMFILASLISRKKAKG